MHFFYTLGINMTSSDELRLLRISASRALRALAAALEADALDMKQMGYDEKGLLQKAARLRSQADEVEVVV